MAPTANHRALAAVIVIASLGTTTAALAQAPERSIPDFVTLDRVSTGRIFGIDYGLGHLVGENSIYAIQRFEAHFHVLEPDELGFYGSLPLHWIAAEGEDQLAVGAFELGVLYEVAPDFVLRAGTSQPLISNDIDGIYANILGSAHRITDRSQATPRSIVTRFGVSRRGRFGAFVYQVDVGIDLPLFTIGDAVTLQDPLRHHLVVRTNVGLGYQAQGFAVVGEFASWLATQSNEIDANAYTAGANIVFDSQRRPYFGVHTVLNDLLAYEKPFILMRTGFNTNL